MNRRGFLAAGAGVLGLAATGCHGGRRRTPVPTASAGSTDWSGLARSLSGRLLRPGDAGYDVARLPANPRFDGIRPAAVARCASAADVRACVAFAAQTGVPFAVRSGGHSYAGYSTSPGLTVDVSGLASVRADPPAGTAVVGAGARLVDVYGGLAAAGVAVPGGSCPTVGIGGLTLGGGIGVVSRAAGLTCDALVGAEVVTADGRLLTCDAQTHPDLFWALRGGGGSFGAVTAFTFRTRPASALTLAFLRWDWSRAAAVLSGWQPWAVAAPDETWSTCHLLSRPGAAAPGVTVGVVSTGGAEAVRRQLDDLVAAVGAAPAMRSAETVPYLHAMLVEAGCATRPVADCRFRSDGGVLDRQPEAAKSHLLTAPLPPGGVDALVAAVEDRQRQPRLAEGGAAFDALGGAVGRVPADATAFVHRDAVLSVQYTADWATEDGGEVVAENESWLARTYAALQPYASGQAYQNYVDPDVDDPAAAYYGANYPRLQSVKAVYDPDDLFHVPQGVAPAG